MLDVISNYLLVTRNIVGGVDLPEAIKKDGV